MSACHYIGLIRLYFRQFVQPRIPGHLSCNPARLSRTYPQSLLTTPFCWRRWVVMRSNLLMLCTERQIAAFVFACFQRHACELIESGMKRVETLSRASVQPFGLSLIRNRSVRVSH
jgi:hypothetical protein